MLFSSLAQAGEPARTIYINAAAQVVQIDLDGKEISGGPDVLFVIDLDKALPVTMPASLVGWNCVRTAIVKHKTFLSMSFVCKKDDVRLQLAASIVDDVGFPSPAETLGSMGAVCQQGTCVKFFMSMTHNRMYHNQVEYMRQP